MAAYCLKKSIILIILSAIIAQVASEKVYIVSPSQQECPGQASGEQCLTLQQFVTGNYTTNFTSLQILPGIHQIDLNDTNISVSTIYSLKVNGSNATILCNSNYFKFRKIDRINIHGVRLMGCRGTSFTSVQLLTIHDTQFEHHGPVILNSVFKATIANSSIVNGRKLLVHSSTLLIKTALFSNLTVSNDYFEWNQDPHGGAMWTNNSNITIEQCVFLNNYLYPFNSTIDSWGGAVYANNTRMLIIDSNFTGNSATEAGGAISANNSIVQINNTQFSNNLATKKGGAIHNNIVGSHTTGSVLVYNCRFISNTADLAGALYMAGNDIDIIITTSLFNSNAARSRGGVLFVEGINNSVTIQRSHFADNAAEYYYGGVLYITGSYSMVNISQSMFNQNAANITGGTLYIEGNESAVCIDQSEFLNSRAQEGGILSFTGSNTSIYVSTSVFSNSRATIKGGTLQMLGDHTTIDIHQCHFSNNTADVEGGTIYLKGYQSVLFLLDSTFSNNSAARCAVLEADHGQMLYVLFINSRVINNTAHGESVSDATGGVACLKQASTYVKNSSFSLNEASGNASVFYIENSSLSILQSSFDSNMAGLNGGVVYWYAGTPHVSIDISYSNFSNNLAFINGGVMYVNSSGSQVNVTNSTFANNNATERGGVIAIFGSQLYFDQNIIFDNYGAIISACRSNVTASDDLKQIVEPNPNNSYCSFYDEYQDMPMTTADASTMPGTITTPGTEANTMSGTNETPASPGLTTRPTTPNPTKMEGHSAMPTIPNMYTTAIYTTLGIAIVVCVLLALLYIIVMCIVLYLCGMFKSKKRLVDNPYVYVPMKENESTADNETAAQE